MGNTTFLVALLLMANTYADAIQSPGCYSEEVPVIELVNQGTAETGETSQLIVTVKNTIPVKASWSCGEAGHFLEGESQVTLPASESILKTFVSQPAVNISQAILLDHRVCKSFQYPTFMTEISTVDGPYDAVMVTKQWQRNEPQLTKQDFALIDAPPRVIEAFEGQRLSLKMSYHSGNAMWQAYPQVLKYNSSDMKLTDSFTPVLAYYSSSGSSHPWEYQYSENEIEEGIQSLEGLSQDFEDLGNGSKSYTVNIDFDRKLHEGYYCLNLALSSYHHSGGMAVAACTLVKSMDGEQTKELRMETCSWDAGKPLMDKAPIYTDHSDCIMCITTGFEESSVMLVQKSESGIDQVVPLEEIPGNSVWLKRYAFPISKVNETHEGEYTCLAFDHDDVMKKSLNAKAQRELSIMATEEPRYYYSEWKSRGCMANGTDSIGFFARDAQGNETVLQGTGNPYNNYGNFSCLKFRISDEADRNHEVSSTISFSRTPVCGYSDTSGEPQDTWTITCKVQSEWGKREQRYMLQLIVYPKGDGCCIKRPN